MEIDKLLETLGCEKGSDNETKRKLFIEKREYIAKKIEELVDYPHLWFAKRRWTNKLNELTEAFEILNGDTPYNPLIAPKPIPLKSFWKRFPDIFIKTVLRFVSQIIKSIIRFCISMDKVITEFVQKNPRIAYLLFFLVIFLITIIFSIKSSIDDY